MRALSHRSARTARRAYPARSRKSVGAKTAPTRFLATSVRPGSATGNMATIAAFTDLPESVTFGERYSRRSLLGSGGAAEVHLYADEWIGREVALKALRDAGDDLGTDGIAERFFREARLQGQLEHPSVVPVYDLGVGPDGLPFFTMKRIRGLTLAEVLDRKRAETGPEEPGSYGRRRLLEAFVRICLAVDFAHARGVVHRDLKPSNVMLGAFGEVYVLDWGVAKLLEQAEDPEFEPMRSSLPEIGVTDVGSWMGTPGFMAPEQIDGGPVGPWTDVYSLGTILFEILTREPLHPRKSPVAAISSTRQGVEARPSKRRPELHVPPEFDAILIRATAADPEQRFPSARALAEAIESYLDGHRDQQLRKDIAAGYAVRAQEAVSELDAGTTDDDALQRAALRHVGRALALDPDNSKATELLRQLMLREPHEDPPEVQRAASRTDAEMRRNGVNFLFWRSLLWTACVPLTLWLGYTRPLIAGAAAGGILITMLMLAVLRRLPAISDAMGLALLGMTTMLFGSMSVLFGPFILVPSLVATNSVFFVLHSRPGQRSVIIVAGVLAVMVPFGAEWVGLVPPSYVFEGGHLSVMPRVMAMDETKTTAILAILHVMLAIAPTVIALRMRDELLVTQRKLSLTSWRLGQLATDLREVLTDEPHPT